MSFYTDNFSIRPYGNYWHLNAPLVWEIGYKGSGLFIEVQEGFASDLATIPWFARWAFKTSNPKYAKAAILHDFMLSLRYSKITAASEFYQALKADRVSLWRAIIMGLAVLTAKERNVE